MTRATIDMSQINARLREAEKKHQDGVKELIETRADAAGDKPEEGEGVAASEHGK